MVLKRKNVIITILIFLATLNVVGAKDKFSKDQLAPITSNSDKYNLDYQVLKNAKKVEVLEQFYQENYSEDKNIEENLIFEMQMSLAPFTQELSREIDVYNYRKRRESKVSATPTTSNSDEAIDYTRSWRDAAYKHLPNESGWVGWGLYASTAPNASRSYGGDDMSIFKIKIPENTRMLDLRSVKEEGRGRASIPIKKDLFMELSRLCPNLKPNLDRDGSIHDYYITKIKGKDDEIYSYVKVDKTKLTQDKACNDIFVKSLKKLNIGLISYKWATHNKYKNIDKRGLCNNQDKDNLNTAFVILNTKLDNHTVDYFVSDDKNLNEEARVKYEKLVSTYETFEHTHLGHKPLGVNWSSVSPSIYTKDRKSKLTEAGSEEAKMQEKIRTRTFGCGDEFKEDYANFDILREKALFISEVLRMTNTDSISEAYKCISEYNSRKGVTGSPLTANSRLMGFANDSLSVIAKLITI
jgi:hypothetical protein